MATSDIGGRSTEVWKQFDCTDCIILEYGYLAYMKSKKDKFRHVQIADGLVDLVDYTMVPTRDQSAKIEVKRLPDNTRLRNN